MLKPSYILKPFGSSNNCLKKQTVVKCSSRLTESDKLRLFWMGKKKRVKEATEEYLNSPNEYPFTQRYFANKYNCSVVSIRITFKKLEKAKLLNNYQNIDFLKRRLLSLCR